jgi:hypothetical protein
MNYLSGLASNFDTSNPSLPRRKDCRHETWGPQVCFDYFYDRISLYAHTSLQHELPIYAFHITRKTDTRHHAQLFILFYFSVLGLELRAYTLSHSISPSSY